MTWRTNTRGQSLLEVIVAMAIFALISTAMITLAMGGFTGLEQGGEHTQAQALAQQGYEAVRSIRDGAWNEMSFTTSTVSVSSTQWIFDGENTTSTIGQYTRTISFDDVCRDSNDDIVDCPGTYTDVATQKITVAVVWEVRPGVDNRVEHVAYLTNWDSYDWTQTDWIGGNGQAVWSDTTHYESDDGNIDVSTAGQVTLLRQPSSCGPRTWGFTASSSYTFDNTKIEVTGGVAQILDQGGGASGFTTNFDFDTDSTGWTYYDWDQSGGETDVTGTYNTTAGNPDGWIDMNFPAGKNDEFGGYWEQSFTTTQDNPSVTVDFDWQVTQYETTPNTFQLYVFVDSASGEPTIGQEIWSSGEQTSTQGWTSQIDVDASSQVGTAGTYYFKVAVWLETDGGDNDGPYEVGYDNVQLDWSASGVNYPTDDPNIYPNQSHTVSSIDTWSSFTETATKNGGEIYYQLSDDGGSTWQYWSGSSWVTAGATNFNTAATINSNISNFNTSTGQIVFQAFLSSDGIQQIQLDDVTISCSQGFDWTFDTPGDYVYDSGKITVTSSVAELVYTDAGGSCSGTPTTCDTYGDETSCTGQSGCSWGGGGAGYCSEVGSCSAEPPGQCNNSCGSAGCSKSRGQCSGTLDCSVYTTEGDCGGCGQCAWVPGGVSCSGMPDACNTFVDNPSCSAQVGCSWSGSGGGYDSTIPSIYPSTSLSVSTSTLSYWATFTEDATKNTGEIFYQLSDDNGTTWYYWNGGAWVNAGATNYNTASDINTNIQTFSTSTGQLSFKAFLESDGSVQVQLDTINVTWSEGEGGGGSGGYATSGYLISSAFDMTDSSPVQIISWSEDVSSCDPNCDIQLQVRIAPDNTGSPGTWTSWYGVSGAGSYFTDPFGTLISTDLNGNEWVQYRVELIGDGTQTPILQDITVNHK